MRTTGIFAAIMGAAALMATASVAQAQDDTGYWQDIQSRGVLRCGVAAAPPHVIRDPLTGEYSGTFVDLCREFGETVLGVEVEMVDTTWDNIVAGLQAGRWDLSLALNRTPRRAMAVAFSEPAWHYEIAFVFDADNPKLPDEVVGLADVDKEGVVLTVMSGTAQDQTLTALVEHAEIMRLPDVDATRLALSSRRADVLVDDSDTSMMFAATDHDRWTLLLPTPALSKQGMGFGLRRDASIADLQVLNIFIEERLATGQIQAIGQAYIDAIAGSAE